MNTRIVLAVSLIILASTALASTGARDVDTARELFRSSGMESQIASILPQVEQQFRAQAGDLSPKARSDFLEVARDSFNPVEMGNATLGYLQARMDRANADAAVEWLHSITGRRITKLEEAASQPESMPKLEAYAASLEANPPDAERVALVQRLDRAARATEVTTEILSTISLAAGRAMLIAMPSAGSVDQLEAQILAQQPILREAAQGFIVVSSLYTYGDLSEGDFTSYIRFLESPAGQWYMRATSDSFMDALREAAERYASGLARVLQNSDAR